jgi:ABC-type uncharacterized transport system fused permease/ATPase subunit
MLTRTAMIFLRMQVTNVSLDLDRAVVSSIYLRDTSAFARSMTKKVVLSFLENSQWALSENLMQRVSYAWRKKLTAHIHAKYFDRQAYYRVANLPGAAAISDPEERIVQDVERVLLRLAWQVGEVGESVLMTVYTCVRLRNQMGLSMVAFSLFYSWFSIWLREAISPGIESGTVAGQTVKVAGQYRTAHARLLQHAEAVACYGGAEAEARRIGRASANFYAQWRRMSLLNIKSSLSMMLQWSVFQQTVMSVVVHIPYLGGRHEFQLGTDAGERARLDANAEALGSMGMQSMLLRNAMMNLGSMMRMRRSLMIMSGMCNRIAGMVESLEAAAELAAPPAALNDAGGDPAISFDGVDISTPGGVPLVSGLALALGPADGNLLLCGPDGAGKTSICRVLRDLWPANRPAAVRGSVLYLPQTPHLLPFGSLDAQIAYPRALAPGEALPAAVRADVLEVVGLGGLERRLAEGGQVPSCHWSLRSLR